MKFWTPPLVQFSLLPPANEVCEGYVFTGVCLSTGGVCHRSGGVCHIPLPGQTPPGRHPPPDRCPNGQTPPWADTPTPGQTPPFPVHAGIRSTSGWYASHWNAFLFPCSFRKFWQNNRLMSLFRAGAPL